MSEKKPVLNIKIDMIGNSITMKGEGVVEKDGLHIYFYEIG